MKQASLKLKMYANNVGVVDKELAPTILRSMLYTISFLALLYVVFLGNMVFNIVERKSLESQARVLNSEVGELELTYLSMSNKIDLNLSRELGFKETNIKFTTRRALGSNTFGNINLANNEI